MPRLKLTKRSADAIEPGAGVIFYWDAGEPGFGLSVRPDGAKSFVVQYRNASGRSKRMVIGRYGVFTVDQAREQARQVMASAALGNDPSARRRNQRQAKDVGALLDLYVKDHLEQHNASNTQARVESILRLHLRPKLGTLPVADITRAEVIRFHRSLNNKPRTANLAIAVLSKVFALAEQWGLRPDNSNPCRGIKKFDENKRDRYLSTEELARLGRTFDEASTIGLPWRNVDAGASYSKHLAKPDNRRTLINSTALAVIQVLLFTGARLSEITELQWKHVDLDQGFIALPGSKGKKRENHPISAKALAIIALRKASSLSEWVFPAPADIKKHISKEVMENVWQRVRHHAKLDDVRLHDLRHTVGTFAGQGGANAFTVRDVLRHATLAMTGRYVSRDDSPVRALSEAVSVRIAAGLAGSSEVIPQDRVKPSSDQAG